MTKAEIMLGAADLLEKRGRTTGDYIDEDGCLCLVGAIVLAGGGFFKYDDDPDAVEEFVAPTDYDAARASVLAEINDTLEYLAEMIPPAFVTKNHAGACLTDWNDADDRIDAEVLEFLRTNAAELVAS